MIEWWQIREKQSYTKGEDKSSKKSKQKAGEMETIQYTRKFL